MGTAGIDANGSNHHRRSASVEQELRRWAAGSLALDVRRLDDRPPLLDLGLLIRAERLWRLLLAREDLLSDSG